MVARINTSISIAKALNYNEQKVQLGKAEILEAVNFIKDVDQLNFYDKMKQFESHISLNEKAITNTLHISLNFDPSEKISNEKMVEIASSYMNKIGFANQPYLVYRHLDAGHPHLHIVSTNVERNGKRISMHNLGRNQSEKARKEIEIVFDLVKAESKKTSNEFKVVPINVQKVGYGRSETKRAVANVLMMVIDQYKYTSLPELNAVLKLYNVAADRGSEHSRMFQQNGLTYRVLDDAGKKIGTPIKASAFYMKPTLANLERKFVENESLRLPFKKKLQVNIGWLLNKQSANLVAFTKALEKENITAILRKGKGDVIYGITYIDHTSKSVFNGSDLGKEYSAKAVLEKYQQSEELKAAFSQSKRWNLQKGERQKKDNKMDLPQSHKQSENLLEPILSPTLSNVYMPHQLLRKKKRKRKHLSI